MIEEFITVHYTSKGGNYTDLFESSSNEDAEEN